MFKRLINERCNGYFQGKRRVSLEAFGKLWVALGAGFKSQFSNFGNKDRKGVEIPDSLLGRENGVGGEQPSPCLGEG